MAAARRSTKLVLFLSLFLHQHVLAGEKPDEQFSTPVQTDTGPVFGLKYSDPEGGANGTFWKFLGIPYAEAPVGSLRFKPPRPKQPWSDPFNATSYGSVCPRVIQFVPNLVGTVVGNEDCLFLNVFLPKEPPKPSLAGQESSGSSSGSGSGSSSLLPVLVYLHAGGFHIGSGQLDPEPLLRRDVVVVSLNFRLGVLGFLTLGTPEVSGNQALRDQLEALRWIRRNIGQFGGDPRRVTLFGVSSGAVSAHLQMLSPLGRGLYQGVIAQSGNALSYTEQMRRRSGLADARALLRHVACDIANASNIASNIVRDDDRLACLQAKSAAELLQVTQPLNDPSLALEAELVKTGYAYTFGPEVDDYAEEPVLPDHPLRILKAGQQKDLPLITGNAENDGTFLLTFIWDKLETISRNWTLFHGPRYLFGSKASQVTTEESVAAELIKRFYMKRGMNKNGNSEFSQDRKESLLDLFNDLKFFSPVRKSLRIQSQTQKSPVFYYRLTHRPSRSVMERFGAPFGAADEDFGVAHADDLLFLLSSYVGLKGAVKTDDDRRTRDNMVGLWTSFAATLDGEVEGALRDWKRFEPDTEHYLDLGPELELKNHVLPAGKAHFWNRVFWNEIEAKMETTK